MVPDAATLEQLRTGDPTAFHWLVEAYAGPLLRYFVAEHRDHHLAEEQTGETFVQLVRSLPAMRGKPCQLPAFVFAVARRIRLRNWRRASRAMGSLDEASEVVDTRPTAATLFAQREEFERILEAMSTLEPVVRDVLMFRYVEGCSLEQVAALVDLPLGTVKSHLHRGLARLRKLLPNSDAIHD